MPRATSLGQETAWQVPLIALRLLCVPGAVSREDSSFYLCFFLVFLVFCPQGPCPYLPPCGSSIDSSGLRVGDIDLRAEAALRIASLCGEGAQRSLRLSGYAEGYNSLEGIWPVDSHLGRPSTSQPTSGIRITDKRRCTEL